MSIFKCKMCGGTLEIQNGESVAVCEYCGTKQTLPKLDNDRRSNLYDRANHFRRNNEYDKAMGIYEQILNEDNTDAEAYWSLVLCRYGIEYVEDPVSRRRVPTVNRAQFTSIFDDADYKSAIQYADGCQQEIYEAEAKTINEIQKSILAISQKEEPFDVFICYKETDANGRRTQDSVLANDLYHELIQEGYKVFFSRITLEDKLGTAYEPYIFAALNSAKVMVVIGTKSEYFNAVWVKNEWSRYLALIKNGAKKILIPAYRDMDPYDLPEEFSHLQAQDMSKLGFMQDLIRGIKKLAAADTPNSDVKETVIVSGGNTNTAPLLKRVFMFLEDGDWRSADDYCEKVLDIDPECAEAYLGKLMAELQVRKQEHLADCAEPFDNHNNYRKTVRFCDEKLKNTLAGDITTINKRNENNRLEGIYNKACNAMNSANNEEAYKSAAEIFAAINNYKDVDILRNQCLEKAEGCRKDVIYASAKQNQQKDFIFGIEKAISLYEQISGWKDSSDQIIACRHKIEEINSERESQRLERERKAEDARIALGKKKKRNKKIAIITTSIVCAVSAFLIVLNTVIIPANNYSKAIASLKSKDYVSAVSLFTKLGKYKDSEEKLGKAENCLYGIDIKQLKLSMISVKVGDTIKLGYYEQDNNTANGKEEIEWVVLAKEKGKALIISKYCLDCHRYNATYDNMTYASVTWKTCSLRSWLNDKFYKSAFVGSTKNMVVSTNVSNNGTDGGNNTTDKVFLLSIDEANKYFNSDSARAAASTEYAKSKGANVAVDGSGNSWWWLRSSGEDQSRAAQVDNYGAIKNDGSYVNYGNNAVRPAVWINLNT